MQYYGYENCDSHHKKYKKCCKPKRTDMYKTIKRECDLHDLTEAINAAGLKDAISTLDPITVFGPTDCGFIKFKGGPTCGDLSEILLYHVVNQKLSTCALENDKLYDTLRDGLMPGSKMKVRANVYSKPTFKDVVTINGTEIVESNIKATNGILHKIDKVLCPPDGTLLDLAVRTPNLSILVAAVLAADPSVASALNNPDLSLTLFAPDNQAFSNLAEELNISLDDLLSFLLDPVNQMVLTDILLYHVLAIDVGTVFSVALKKGCTKNIPTLLADKNVDIKRKCKNIYLRDTLDRKAKVVSKDNLSSNGVAHIIDQVILPFNPLA